jgi:hypothetical protein
MTQSQEPGKKRSAAGQGIGQGKGQEGRTTARSDLTPSVVMYILRVSISEF